MMTEYFVDLIEAALPWPIPEINAELLLFFINKFFKLPHFLFFVSKLDHGSINRLITNYTFAVATVFEKKFVDAIWSAS